MKPAKLKDEAPAIDEGGVTAVTDCGHGGDAYPSSRRLDRPREYSCGATREEWAAYSAVCSQWLSGVDARHMLPDCLKQRFEEKVVSRESRAWKKEFRLGHPTTVERVLLAAAVVFVLLVPVVLGAYAYLRHCEQSAEER